MTEDQTVKYLHMFALFSHDDSSMCKNYDQLNTLMYQLFRKCRLNSRKVRQQFV